MKKTVIQVMKMITKLNKSMIWVVGVLVFFASIFLFIDVLLRYFFNSATAWAFDLAVTSTGFIGFMLGGYALAIGQHVRVDLFYEKFSLRVRSIIDLISALFLFLMAGALFWLGMDYVIHYYTIGAVTTGGVPMPLWIKWLMVPLGGLLIGLQGLVKLTNDIYIIVTGEELYNSEEGV
ncbi:TRAP transporter small permease subunit [Alkalihalobacterium elongatum]|uniref:TRAP transporter small permease subunit n=1 Tax=Alkalihalobacterium elongatum TaxID=2675466 RepID=UPI001C1F7AD8|nr:TRAP transporter small permease subunit [Alkalihalobacterium elongatum]